MIYVPCYDSAVGSSSGKGSVEGVEGYVVYGVDGVVYAMAFEGILLWRGAETI